VERFEKVGTNTNKPTIRSARNRNFPDVFEGLFSFCLSRDSSISLWRRTNRVSSTALIRKRPVSTCQRIVLGSQSFIDLRAGGERPADVSQGQKASKKFPTQA
jgi:hypothetical protein